MGEKQQVTSPEQLIAALKKQREKGTEPVKSLV